MLPKLLLRPILNNDAVTRGLADPEARVLVEWLVDRVERQGESEPCQDTLAGEVERLCRRARSISRFVSLWCHQELPGAACQLAATERFNWPLPVPGVDPCELMEQILACEEEQ
jgi:hypothetical protein